MESGRIKPYMSETDLFSAMMEGEPQTSDVLMQMIYDEGSFSDIYFCDSLDLRGPKLYKLYTVCCGSNFDKFKRTLMMIKSGAYSREEVHGNLDLESSIPFISDCVKVKGLPSYEDGFKSVGEKWYEFCLLNRQLFIERFAKAKEEETTVKMG